MPSVVQLNPVVNVGSTGRIVEGIGQFLIQKNWNSYIAYGRQSHNSKSQTIKIGNELDARLHAFKTRLFDRHGLGSKNATAIFVEELKRTKPDIIHLHNLHGYYLNYPVLFNYISNIKTPIVWTLHDCWAITGHCSYFSDINCNKWKKHCEHCPKTKNYPSSLFIDNSHSNFQIKRDIYTEVKNLTLVTVSHWLSSLVKESILQSHPLKVIHNGIDVKEFSPKGYSENLDKKYGFNGRKVLIASATSWAKNKGWDDYIKLSQVIPKNFVIVLVGVSQKQKTSLPKEIIGIERTESTAELAALYSHAIILLNLSYQETFGLTTIESFACGTPTIVYNATASPELLSEDTGIVVEPGRIDEVLFAIKTIDANGKESYTDQCRKRALEKFNEEDRYRDYYELYNSLL